MGIKSLIEKITNKKSKQPEEVQESVEMEVETNEEVSAVKTVDKIDQKDIDDFLRLTNPDLGESHDAKKEKHFEYIEYGSGD